MQEVADFYNTGKTPSFAKDDYQIGNIGLAMKTDAGKYSKAQEELIRKQIARAKQRKRLRDAQKNKSLKASKEYSGMAQWLERKTNH